MLKACLACSGVLVAGTAAMFTVPFALELWDGEARAVDAALLILTLAAFAAVARATLGRPYLRRQTVIAAAVSPFATALALAAVVFGLELAGADCPRSGMDYISECNDLAGASMMVSFVGLYLVGMQVLIALAVLPAAGLKRTLEARRRGGSARAAGGWR
jgi:hypothetical protein